MSVLELEAIEDQLVPPGVPLIGSVDGAIDVVVAGERARRMAAVVAVDSIEALDASRVFVDQGHASARVMYAHVAGVSGAEAFRLDRIRRMVHSGRLPLIDAAWRRGMLGFSQAVLIAKVWANPRVREAFVADEAWFVDRAQRWAWPKFEKRVARWVELADEDGPTPRPDPAHERRDATLTQDHFAKAWHLRAQLGSLLGSRFAEIFEAYVDAELAADWEAARAELGDNATFEDLPRTAAQRRADALCQMAEDAAANPNPSVRVKRVHNLVWDGPTAEELFRRWSGAEPQPLDPEVEAVRDLDGRSLDSRSAIADLVTGTFRRVVRDHAGVTVDLTSEARFYTGLVRLGVELSRDTCFWPGCHKPTTRCQIDHRKPAARGGLTDQSNGDPACQRHNLVKEAGYTVHRAPDGAIKITTPRGETVR